MQLHTKLSSIIPSAAQKIQDHKEFNSTPNSAPQQIQQHTTFSSTQHSAAHQIKQHTKLTHNKTTIHQNVPRVPEILSRADLKPAFCAAVCNI
jgi:hypothetical protein